MRQTLSTDESPAAAPRGWSYFGGLALVCLVLQGVTGVLLAFAYEPTADRAYAATYYITHAMTYGWLVRTVHVWAAVLATAFVVAHAAQVFVTASYKRSGLSSWTVGVGTFALIAAMSSTGRALPWDQHAYWTTANAISWLGHLPLVGQLLERAALMPDGTLALGRFYAAHIVLFTALLAGLVTVHVWQARKRLAAVSTAEEPAAHADSQIAPAASESVRSARMASAATTVVLLLSLFAVLAILAPATLEVRADPAGVPTTAETPWPLLPAVGLSRFVPDALAATLPLLLFGMLVVLPYLDRNPSRRASDRMLVLAAGAVAAGALVLFGLLGLAG